MKKIGKRIAKIFSAMGMFLFGIYNKVSASDSKIIPSLYNKYEERIIVDYIRILFIPVIVMIGLIIYWKTSKLEKDKKRNTVIFIIILTIILTVIYVLINYDSVIYTVS